MPQFMVPIGCCPRMLFPIRPSTRDQAKPGANPSSHERLTQLPVGGLGCTRRLLARHGEIGGRNQAVDQMIGMRQLLVPGCVWPRVKVDKEGQKSMGLYDSSHAGLTCPNGGCQAGVEAQTKDFETAMLTCPIGEPVEPLPQADLHGLTGCRWCEASIEVLVHSAIQIQRPQGQALGHGGEFAAAADARGAEARLEQTSNGRDEGRATGHEHRADVAGRDSGLRQQPVETGCDGYDLLSDPVVKLLPPHRLLDAERRIAECQNACLVLRQLDFGLLHSTIEMVAQVILDDMNQRRDLLRLEGLQAELGEHPHGLLRLQE